MIERVELVGWRAYERLDLAFEPGTTFVIARNGVGKTSLIEALLWGFFGDEGVDFKPQEGVRYGHVEASVVLHLRLPDGRLARVARSVRSDDGKGDVSVAIQDDLKAGQRALDDVVREAYESDPAFLARICVLREGSIAREVHDTVTGELNEHLERVLGIADLSTGSGNAGEALQLARAETNRIRQRERADRKERATWESAVADWIEREEQLRDQIASRSRIEDDRVAEYDVARRWEEYQSALATAEVELSDLRASALAYMELNPSDDVEIGDLLETERGRIVGELEDAREGVGGALARIELIQRFSTDLSHASDLCPLCLRELSEEEATLADRGHRDELAAAKESQRLYQDTIDRLATELRGIRALADQLARITQPTPVPQSTIDAKAAGETLDAARSELDEARATLAAGEGAAEAFREQIFLDDAARETLEQGAAFYRQEALSHLVQQTLVRVVEELRERNIAPLTNEISSRWKEISSGQDELRVSDGQIGLMRDGHTVPFTAMSGGERVVAILILRIVTAFMTTRARFLWLDEPLEHLDPTNRRMIASTLVEAGREGQFDQIIVTTYEEPTARKLAAESDRAHIVYVASDNVD